MMNRQLASAWTTLRCWVRDAAPDDAAALAQLYNSRAALSALDPTFYLVDDKELLDHIHRSVDDAAFRLQAFGVLGTDQPVGYFHLSMGAPRPHTTWLSMMVVGAVHAGHGYGREAGAGLLIELGRLGWCDAVWLKVYLANTAALRHWVSVGFRSIVEVRAAVSETGGDPPCVILSCDLR